MQQLSTFNLTIGNALLWQGDVMAEIFRDTDGGWYVFAVYADPLEIAGKPVGPREWVEIPADHFLHDPVKEHFEKNCADKISDRWERHAWRYMPPRSLVSAGREM
jgi:hypothetical protein